MNTKTHSIFKALEQYPNISVEEFEPELLAENVINKTQKIYIKDCGKVIFEFLLAPPFGVAVKSPMGIEIPFIGNPDEVIKAIENELKQNNF